VLALKGRDIPAQGNALAQGFLRGPQPWVLTILFAEYILRRIFGGMNPSFPLTGAAA